MDFETKSRVYIITDEQSRVTQIEGEYSLSNIQDLSSAILVEEGEPCDRLNHAQNHYLPKPIRTYDGLYRYKWTGSEIVERTEEEMEADLPKPNPSELREKAYNTEKCVSFGNETLTVTEAAQLWMYYAAEGSDRTIILSAAIEEAKAAIRERYPDEEVD